MMTLDDLPPITGGTDKQKMFADSVRLNFLVTVEERLPNLIDDAYDVVKLKTSYRWWIDRASKIDATSLPRIVAGIRSRIKKLGSLDEAILAEHKAEQKAQDYWQDRKILGGILEQ
jgi:hypothetical protein